MDCLYFRQRPDRDLSLVTLHGFLGDGRSLERVTALVREHFVRAESLLIPGHAGERFEPEWRWSDVVPALNERLAGEGNVIVGYSMGARLALSMLLDLPQRFAGAVLVGVDPGIEDEGARAERQRWERSMRDAIVRDGLEAFARAWQALPVFESQRSLPKALREELLSRRSQHEAAGVAWAMTALGTGAMPSRWGELASISAPVVLVTGERDEKFTAIAARMVQRNPRWISHRVAPSAGHDVTIEAPEFVASALEFVRQEAQSG
jgi:2-succinyl-6-hydroxy-2,4-cyclohexadiene-1-carboxylate synthase